MQEFIYFHEENLEFPLSESIKVTQNKKEEGTYLISNSKEVKSEFYAPEIDFYIKNSQDSFSEKIRNVERLYEINSVRFDHAQDISYNQEIGNKLLLVGSNEQSKEFISKLDKDDFDLFNVQPEIIKAITGHIGNLSVVVNDNNKDVILKVDQIVWYDATDIAKRQSGSFDPVETSLEEVLLTIKANVEDYEYRKFTVYDTSICQYHERRDETCGKCEEVCPTTAIVKIDESKHLEFSQIDCHGCGGCISVCPSGAVDYAPTNRESLFQISKMYTDSIPLVVPAKMEIENLNVPIKENVLPFAIDGEKFLHESTLLTLIQESGSQVIFYSDFLSKGTRDTIQILNDIFLKKYNKKAIILAMTQDELVQALEEVSFIENVKFSYNQDNERKREVFAIRLKNIVQNDDLGTVKTGEHIHYGKVIVNQDTCTLCLACVGACNVDALSARATDNTLRFNASICTSCGFCEVTCPEKDCLTIEHDTLDLNPAWFSENVLAKDTLFACVECGKEFATTKSVEKIATMMAPIFALDPVKQRTLYCCEDCKPKIMMQNYVDNKHLYNK